jgi:RNA polymerase sigma factor (sigma-70 family)
MEKLQAGDSPAWDVAFHSLWPVAYQIVRFRLQNSFPADMEDVAIVAIGEAAKEVRDCNVATFEELVTLTRIIADRRARDLIRRRNAERRRAGATESLEGHAELPSTEPGPLDQVAACDLAVLLSKVAELLSPDERQLLLAYYHEGLKQTELAQRFGLPLGTVGVKLSRALERLRNALSKNPTLLYYLKEILKDLR